MNRSGSSLTVSERLLGPSPWLSFLFLLVWMCLGVSAHAQIRKAEDHGKTGYALTGSHSTAKCEACHLNGVFKGTPRECVSCHTSGASHARSNVVKPANHLPTQNSCDTCHITRAFSGARFSHSGVQSGTCTNCHNGIYTSGKPQGHISTQASCDTCHRPSGWRPATAFDHTNVTPGTCATCHNGVTATGKHALHMPVAGASTCDNCHRPTGWKPTLWNHSQLVVSGQCATCHSGAYPPADGPVVNHIPYKSVTGITATNCDSCHKGYGSWATGMLHSSVSVSSQCATCHTGSYLGAVGKPATATHASVTGNCESCHKSTTSWASSGKPDHSLFTAATNCAGCHNGSTATGRPSTHIPMGNATCTTCHNTTGWKPTLWNHSQLVVSGQCATCHSGAYPPADGPVVNHIPYKSVTGITATNCDSCHKGYGSWATGMLHSSVSVSSQCATCHTGSYLGAVGKPATATHASVTGNCESCHKSTTSWTSGTSFVHSAANAVGTGACDNCHNGSTAKGKPATHIPVPAGSAKCDSCHKSQVSFALSFTMNHSVVISAACKTCHNGSYTSVGTQGALAKPAAHIPEVQLLSGATMDCKDCHSGTTSWLPARMNHNASQGSGSGWCKACHASGTAYQGSMEKKSLTHKAKTTTPTDCSTSGCHKPLGNKGQAYSSWGG